MLELACNDDWNTFCPVLSKKDRTAQTVQELTDIMQELAKRVEDQDARLKSQQMEQKMETAALKRRMEDLQQSSLKEVKTVRQELLDLNTGEYDLALDSLGSLIEDVARRMTRAVQRFEERGIADLERTRDQVEKSLATHSTILTQKIDAALAAAVDRSSQASDHADRESREGDEDHGGGTGSASAKKPYQQIETMRRVETIAQMLRNEALAQTQAFEAKLSSIEAAHSAEAKRWQGMLSSSFTQLQGLQRSISQLECGLTPAGPQGGSIPMPLAPPAKNDKEITNAEKLREDLSRKLRGIASSVNGALVSLESQAETRGQSPQRARSPVVLPLNPAGTMEKQMRQRTEKDQVRSPPVGIPMTGPLEMREDGKAGTGKKGARQDGGRRPGVPNRGGSTLMPVASTSPSAACGAYSPQRDEATNPGSALDASAHSANRMTSTQTTPLRKNSSRLHIGMNGTHPAGMASSRTSIAAEPDLRNSMNDLQRARTLVPLQSQHSFLLDVSEHECTIRAGIAAFPQDPDGSPHTSSTASAATSRAPAHAAANAPGAQDPRHHGTALWVSFSERSGTKPNAGSMPPHPDLSHDGFVPMHARTRALKLGKARPVHQRWYLMSYQVDIQAEEHEAFETFRQYCRSLQVFYSTTANLR
eukprot:s3476_g5.t1